MRVAVYDRYWRTLGGGEQFAGGIAEALAADGHEVDVLGPDAPDRDALLERLGVDLQATRYRAITDEASVSAASSEYELLVNCTYLSFAPNRAHHGLYVAHFPAPPAGAARRAQALARKGVALGLGVVPGLPPRLARVRDDWRGSPASPRVALATYSATVANSHYTQRWLQRLWDVEADVLNPPVRLVDAPRPAAERERIILGVGRFIDPSLGHCKKQVELVQAFRRLCERHGDDGWSLHLVGGCERANRDYYLAVRRAAEGVPVHVHVNAPGAVLRDLWGRAALYWHGAGLGEDPERAPDRFEHFGISVVEAMSAGLVPLVFDAAGPAEIVGEGIGVRWDGIDALVAATEALRRDPARRAALALAARDAATGYGFAAFSGRLRSTVAALGEAPR